jgi:mannose-6-phosphate isomerase-like protein (cupin superfamily)|tara:strand:+ start:1939 stop:2298 length:360 start_codon:yes stop_codon:yes gene_type:complete
MILKEIDKLESFLGEEGTEIRQIFHPHNTLNGIRYSIAHSKISPGKTSIPHKLKSSEVYYVLNGEGIIHVNDKTKKIHMRQSIFVPAFSKQYIENIGQTDLEVLCIVDPAWKQEDEISD